MKWDETKQSLFLNTQNNLLMEQRITFPRTPETQPKSDTEILEGYDEVEKKWVKVQYRTDSNCFFDYPYTGALYPKYRMSLWRKLTHIPE